MPQFGETTIILCDRFPFVGASADKVEFPFVQIDASYKTAELRVHQHTHETGQLNAKVEMSLDGTGPTDVGSTNVTATGPTTTAISSGILPVGRLVLTAQGAATRCVTSVALLLKR